MASFTEQAVEYNYEINGPYREIHFMKGTQYLNESGQIIGKDVTAYIFPAGALGVGTTDYTPTDVSSQSANVQALASLFWTDEVKTAHHTYLKEN
tara:strand:- start:729 stop:1013 length:285 start_codon:yes stop_codon:yes gene_type:complete